MNVFTTFCEFSLRSRLEAGVLVLLLHPRQQQQQAIYTIAVADMRTRLRKSNRQWRHMGSGLIVLKMLAPKDQRSRMFCQWKKNNYFLRKMKEAVKRRPSISFDKKTNKTKNNLDCQQCSVAEPQPQPEPTFLARVEAKLWGRLRLQRHKSHKS